MPGKRNAVKASNPAKTRRNELLKSNSTKDKAITIAINNPKMKSKKYFKDSFKDWSNTQFLITAMNIIAERKIFNSYK